jgi:hypothetical protein
VIAGDSDNNFDLNYDGEKYKEMLLDAAETTLASGSVWWNILCCFMLSDSDIEYIYSEF